MRKQLPLGELADLVGSRIGASDWFTIDQDRIDRFAAATEDYQWIHVDPVKAAKSFGSTIAHGFLTLSLIPYFSSQVSIAPVGTRMTMNYGFNRVRLIAPVPVGAAIRDVLALVAIETKGADKILMTTRHTIEIQGADKPACIADILALHVIDSSVDALG